MRRTAGVILLAVTLGFAAPRLARAADAPAAPTATPAVKVFPADEQTVQEKYRRAIVARGVNEPDPYPGYTGFYGWQGIAKTKTGALLLTFSSGYWHGSPPTPL